MSMFDSILGESGAVQNLAAKVGLSPDEVESALAALGKAHLEGGDTVQSASAATGLPTDKLGAILDHIGGEGSLTRFASMLEGEGGLEGSLSAALGGLPKFP